MKIGQNSWFYAWMPNFEKFLGLVLTVKKNNNTASRFIFFFFWEEKKRLFPQRSRDETKKRLQEKLSRAKKQIPVNDKTTHKAGYTEDELIAIFETEDESSKKKRQRNKKVKFWKTIFFINFFYSIVLFWESNPKEKKEIRTKGKIT